MKQQFQEIRENQKASWNKFFVRLGSSFIALRVSQETLAALLQVFPKRNTFISTVAACSPLQAILQIQRSEVGEKYKQRRKKI